MTAIPAVVGVFGGGRMGAGIAHSFLTAGSAVALIEANAELAEAARGRVSKGLAAGAERGLLSDSVDTYLERLTVTDDPNALAQAGLVIEAVPEDPAIKATIFAAIEAVVGPEAVLASNTSSLSIDGLAAGLRDPVRFLGLHFFNPVPASKLVEIVVGASTEPQLVQDAQGWVEALGKTAVTVQDAPALPAAALASRLPSRRCAWSTREWPASMTSMRP